MPAPVNLTKAKLTPIKLGTSQTAGASIEVQFNPESLKLSYSSSVQGADQSGGAAMQFVSQSTTKLAFDLWFDVSAPKPATGLQIGISIGGDSAEPKDVRKVTAQIVNLMRPTERRTDTTQDNKTVEHNVPPGVRFEWGAFQFDGVVDSINETIDFFSPDGHALRSQLSVSISQQEIPASLLQDTGPDGGPPSPGLAFQASVGAGDSLQSLAGGLGIQDDWQDLASLNDIEDPRNLEVGTLLTLGG
jgi:hypothetical protein